MATSVNPNELKFLNLTGLKRYDENIKDYIMTLIGEDGAVVNDITSINYVTDDQGTKKLVMTYKKNGETLTKDITIFDGYDFLADTDKAKYDGYEGQINDIININTNQQTAIENILGNYVYEVAPGSEFIEITHDPTTGKKKAIVDIAKDKKDIIGGAIQNIISSDENIISVERVGNNVTLTPSESIVTGFTEGKSDWVTVGGGIENNNLTITVSDNIGTEGDKRWAPKEHTHDGTEVTLTGYTKATSVAAVTATDNVNQAVGKLEKKIDNVTTEISTAYVSRVVNEGNIDNFGIAIGSDESSNHVISNVSGDGGFQIKGEINSEEGATTLYVRGQGAKTSGFGDWKEISSKGHTHDASEASLGSFNEKGAYEAVVANDSLQTAVEKLQYTATAFNTFMTSQDTDGVIDNLTEINKNITENTGAFIGLSTRVSDIENGTKVVSSFGGKTGAITVDDTTEDLYVKFEMADQKLRGEVNGVYTKKEIDNLLGEKVSVSGGDIDGDLNISGSLGVVQRINSPSILVGGKDVATQEWVNTNYQPIVDSEIDALFE